MSKIYIINLYYKMLKKSVMLLTCYEVINAEDLK